MDCINHYNYGKSSIGNVWKQEPHPDLSTLQKLSMVRKQQPPAWGWKFEDDYVTSELLLRPHSLLSISFHLYECHGIGKHWHRAYIKAQKAVYLR